MDKPFAAIFDMDGVLVDTYRAHFRSWLEMAAAEGLQFSEEEFAPTFGRTSREIIAQLWGKDRYDGTRSPSWTAARRRPSVASSRRISRPCRAPSICSALHAAGFRLAVGSSGPPENVQLVVDKLGARELFGAVITGADVTRGKPDPQVFLLAAERLGVQPARCAVVEDAPVGVAAANAAGMASVGLLSTGRTREDLAAAAAVVRSLSEISPSMLRDLIARRR